MPQRLGSAPLAVMGEVLSQGFFEVLSACGVPPGLFAKMGATGQRGSYRRFVALTVTPLGRLLEVELWAKLEVAIKVGFSGLYAHDLSGQARAFHSMVGGGMDVAKAVGLAGLMEGE